MFASKSTSRDTDISPQLNQQREQWDACCNITPATKPIIICLPEQKAYLCLFRVLVSPQKTSEINIEHDGRFVRLTNNVVVLFCSTQNNDNIQWYHKLLVAPQQTLVAPPHSQYNNETVIYVTDVYKWII